MATWSRCWTLTKRTEKQMATGTGRIRTSWARAIWRVLLMFESNWERYLWVWNLIYVQTAAKLLPLLESRLQEACLWTSRNWNQMEGIRNLDRIWTVNTIFTVRGSMWWEKMTEKSGRHLLFAVRESDYSIFIRNLEKWSEAKKREAKLRIIKWKYCKIHFWREASLPVFLDCIFKEILDVDRIACFIFFTRDVLLKLFYFYSF